MILCFFLCFFVFFLGGGGFDGRVSVLSELLRNKTTPEIARSLRVGLPELAICKREEIKEND
jgi:hypothetical protein